MISNESLKRLILDCEDTLINSGQRERMQLFGVPIYTYQVDLRGTTWCTLYHINSIGIDLYKRRIDLYVDIEFFEINNFCHLGLLKSFMDDYSANLEELQTSGKLNVSTDLSIVHLYYHIDSDRHTTYGKIFAYPSIMNYTQLTFDKYIQKGTHYFNHDSGIFGESDTITIGKSLEKLRDCRVRSTNYMLTMDEYRGLHSNGVSLIASNAYNILLVDSTEESKRDLLTLFENREVTGMDDVVLYIILSNNMYEFREWFRECLNELSGRTIFHRLKIQNNIYIEGGGYYSFYIKGKMRNYQTYDLELCSEWKSASRYFELVKTH